MFEVWFDKLLWTREFLVAGDIGQKFCRKQSFCDRLRKEGARVNEDTKHTIQLPVRKYLFLSVFKNPYKIESNHWCLQRGGFFVG